MAVKEKIGFVISDSMIRTRIVLVKSQKTHRIYKKVITVTKRYPVHDFEFNSKIGDKVLIQETSPISRTKNWKLTKILTKVSI